MPQLLEFVFNLMISFSMILRPELNLDTNKTPLGAISFAVTCIVYCLLNTVVRY